MNLSVAKIDGYGTKLKPIIIEAVGKPCVVPCLALLALGSLGLCVLDLSTTIACRFQSGDPESGGRRNRRRTGHSLGGRRGVCRQGQIRSAHLSPLCMSGWLPASVISWLRNPLACNSRFLQGMRVRMLGTILVLSGARRRLLMPACRQLLSSVLS